MILKPYEVGDLVEFMQGYVPTGIIGLVTDIALSGRPVVLWFRDGRTSTPDYDRMRRVEAKNAV